MRTNLPVTDIEYVLPDDAMLVSKTDLKGLITYCNPAFVEASGFSMKELIGAPHNLVRHPDMPAEAFADLWATLKQGKPWSGLVKNRRKNGDFYWVIANATPIWENGQLVGYMSVRSTPNAAQKAAAGQFYAELKAGQSKKRVFRGAAVTPGLGFTLRRLAGNLSITKRLAGLVGLLIAAMLALGTMGYLGVKDTADRAKETRGQMRVLTESIDHARQAQVDFKTQVQEWKNILLRGQDPAQYEKYLGQFDKEGANVQANLNELKPIFNQLGLDTAPVDTAMASHAELMRKYHEALQSYGSGAATVDKLVKGMDRAPVEQIDGIVKQIQEHSAALQTKADADAEAAIAKELTVDLGIVGTVVALALMIATLIIRSITQPVRAATHSLEQIAQGNLHIDHRDHGDSEMGEMMDAMRSMGLKQGFDLAEAKRLTDEALRIQIALDNVSANVMVADNSRHIIYMNKSVEGMFKNAEADIRKQLPDFDASQLLGANIDGFHKNPSHQANLLATFTSTYKSTLNIGGRTMTVVANPVMNDKGERLGSVVEWADRTLEVAVEKEVAELVNGAAAGDFSRRLAREGKEGFFLQLAEGINKLAETSERGMNDVARVLKALADGDLTQRIDGDYQGLFGELKDATNTTSERLKEVVGQIREATDAINTAAREIASGNVDLSSRTENQASSLEQTAASMDELTSTVKNNADNARQADKLAQGASGVAVKGGAVVGEVVHTMSAIADSSKKIADIISVIDGIAFQTNILALNAAVEAARAGEQGRGFAVVAGEVRSLAQRSAAAAKEIKELISDSVDKVDNGYKLVEQAGSTMNEIVDAVKRVTDIMGEITHSSEEQSQGISQVNAAVTQMDEMTQQNAALVEEAAAAAESLQEQAEGLSRAVAVFKIAGGSARLAPPPASRPASVAPRAAAKPVARPVAAKPKAPAADADEWEEF